MADYYTQFSTCLATNNPSRSRKWYDEHVAKRAEDDDMDIDEFHEKYGFSITLYEEAIYLFSEDSGNVEAAANCIQQYLMYMNMPGYHLLQWANTCSKMRVDAFGGGACLISKDTIIWQDLDEFCKGKNIINK